MIGKLLDAIGEVLFPKPAPRPVPIRVKDRR